MASIETEVMRELFEPMVSDSVASAKTPIGRIAIKKLWQACKDLTVRDRRLPTDTSINHEYPIPEPEAIDIAAKSSHRHSLAPDVVT